MEAPRDFEALKRRLIEIEPGLPKRLRQTAAFALEECDQLRRPHLDPRRPRHRRELGNNRREQPEGRGRR